MNLQALAIAFGLFVIYSLFAFIVESLVEFGFGKLLDIGNVWWGNTGEYGKVMQTIKVAQSYVALGIGLVVANYYQFDIPNEVASVFNIGDLVEHSLIGVIATGFSIGRGSNFIHDIWKLYVLKQPVDKP